MGWIWTGVATAKGKDAKKMADAVAILNEKHPTLVVDGEVIRNESHPCKFNTLHLTYSFNSDADDTMASRWVMASLETYCSTINTIRDTTAITYSITHNSKLICENQQMISGGGSNIDMGEIESCPS